MNIERRHGLGDREPAPLLSTRSTGSQLCQFAIGAESFSRQSRMSSVWQAAADLVIEPDVSAVSYDAFEHARDLIRAGEVATRAALPQLRNWLVEEQQATMERSAATSRPRQASPVGAH